MSWRGRILRGVSGGLWRRRGGVGGWLTGGGVALPASVRIWRWLTFGDRRSLRFWRGGFGRASEERDDEEATAWCQRMRSWSPIGLSELTRAPKRSGARSGGDDGTETTSAGFTL